MIWADAAYRGQELTDWCERVGNWEPKEVQRTTGARRFAVQPKRWVVDHSFAWLIRNRRAAEDYERNVQTSETCFELAATRLLLRRVPSGRSCQAGHDNSLALIILTC
jgi:transposase